MAQSAGAENMKGAEKVHVPPIKTHGIKTKLVPWIARCAPSAAWTVWVEPFMGSGRRRLQPRPEAGTVLGHERPYHRFLSVHPGRTAHRRRL